MQLLVKTLRGQSLDQVEREGFNALTSEGVSIFESMRCCQGQLIDLEAHLNRLWESAKTVKIQVPLGRMELRRQLQEAVRVIQSAFVRLTVGSSSMVLIIAPLRSLDFKRGISVRTSPVRKNNSQAMYPEVKSSSYGTEIYATAGLKDDFFELLFLNAGGFLAEGRVSNFFWIKHKVLMTPPSAGILAGITRKRVLKAAQKARIAVCEMAATRHDLFNADEMFLTNSSGEVVPVRELDGRKIGKKTPGPITLFLMKQFLKSRMKEGAVSVKD